MPLAAALLLAFQAAPAPAEVMLWRLDCGMIQGRDFAIYSDAARYDGRPYTLVDSCYLIRHGGDYLLWDTGLPGALEGKSETEEDTVLSLKERLVPQLARIRVSPEQVRFVGISHYHGDHVGQAADFAGATLLIGAQDWEAFKSGRRGEEAAAVQPWLDGGKVEPVARDKDVFGDGSVVMLATPGHTPGHHSLLVRLKGMGPVLLSGDLFHAQESYDNNVVPAFNTSRADTLASIDRFKSMAANLGATVIIQHEPADVAKLPAFPEGAR